MDQSSESVLAVGAVRTDRPARYGKQLVAHLGRRHGGEWDPDAATGWIALARGRVVLRCETTTLRLDLHGDPAAREQMQEVVVRHLARFATQDELDVTWMPG